MTCPSRQQCSHVQTGPCPVKTLYLPQARGPRTAEIATGTSRSLCRDYCRSSLPPAYRDGKGGLIRTGYAVKYPYESDRNLMWAHLRSTTVWTDKDKSGCDSECLDPDKSPFVPASVVRAMLTRRVLVRGCGVVACDTCEGKVEPWFINIVIVMSIDIWG